MFSIQYLDLSNNQISDVSPSLWFVGGGGGVGDQR